MILAYEIECYDCFKGLKCILMIKLTIKYPLVS